MKYGQFGRAWWGVSTLALVSAMSVATPALAQGGANEITITATRRAGATVQDVPIAVTAIGQETLQNAGVRDVRDLTQLAPSFQFFTGQSNSAGTTAYIRGLGTGGDNPGFESAVGFFVDGVYRNRSGVALSDLPMVDHVEVLRGPQGTLFGKNTTAGAISVITAAPSFTHDMYGYATYGSYDTQELNAGVTGPLGKSVAVRLDADIRKRNGTIHDIRGIRDINTKDRWYVRGQALFEMSPAATLRLIADMSRTKEECCTAVTKVAGSTAILINALSTVPYASRPGSVSSPVPPLGIIPGLIGVQGPVGGGINASVDKRNTNITPGRNFGERIRDWGISGELNWDWGGPKFTSITSYRNWKATRNQDIDFSDLDRAYRDGYKVGFKTFTEEARLQGKNGILDWLIGGYYANEKLPLTDTIRIGADAAEYVDVLGWAQDLSGLGAPDRNGALPGSGYEFFDSIPIPPTGSCLVVGNGCFLANTLPAFGVAPATAAAFAEALRLAPHATGQGQSADNWDQSTKSWALFTHNNIQLAPKWTLTLGYRYNHERKNMNASLSSTLPACGVIQANAASAIAVATNAVPALAALKTGILQFLTLMCNPAVNTISNGAHANTLTENESNGTAVLSWRPNDNFMLYGSFARGYKAGGYNLDRSGFSVVPWSTVAPSASDLKFRAEFTDAYELGWKWSWGGDRSALNGAIFYEDISDYQLNAFSGFNFITFNVPKAISQGFEVEYSTQPSQNWAFQASATYLDAFYDSPVTVVGETLPAGTPVAQAPKWTLTSALTYIHPCPDSALQWLFSIDGRYNTGYRVQTLTRNPATDNDAFAIFNARVGLGRQDGAWQLEGWVRNLTNEFYHIGAFGVPEQTGTYNVYPSEPITFGATLRGHI